MTSGGLSLNKTKDCMYNEKKQERGGGGGEYGKITEDKQREKYTEIGYFNMMAV